MLRGVRLVRGELADSSKNRKISRSRVEEQGPNYLLIGSRSFPRERLGWRGWWEMRGQGRVQVGCSWQGMTPTHTPKDRDKTAWRGYSLA
jgi:hypothetical protein